MTMRRALHVSASLGPALPEMCTFMQALMVLRCEDLPAGLFSTILYPQTALRSDPYSRQTLIEVVWLLQAAVRAADLGYCCHA